MLVLVTCGFSGSCGIGAEPASLFHWWKFVDMGMDAYRQGLSTNATWLSFFTGSFHMIPQLIHANSQKLHRNWNDLEFTSRLTFINCLTGPRNVKVATCGNWAKAASPPSCILTAKIGVRLLKLFPLSVVSVSFPTGKFCVSWFSCSEGMSRARENSCEMGSVIAWHDQLWNGKRWEGLGNRHRDTNGYDMDMIWIWYKLCSRKQRQCHCRMSDSNFSICSMYLLNPPFGAETFSSKLYICDIWNVDIIDIIDIGRAEIKHRSQDLTSKRKDGKCVAVWTVWTVT